MRSKAFLLLLIVFIAFSCEKDDVQVRQRIDLSVDILSATDVRSFVTENTLPSGSSIGLSVTDESGLAYDGIPVSNVRYTSVGQGMSQTWDAASDIMLSNTKGTLKGYFPYLENVSDIMAIPIEASSDVQIDWMWATPTTGLNNRNYSVTLTMNHALAGVRLKIVKGTYSGVGHISSVSFSSDAAAVKALLDATDGSLKSITGKGATYTSSESFVLNDMESLDFITVPSGTDDVINVSAVVDGRRLAGTTESIRLESGKIYEYTIYIGIKELLIKCIEIVEWTDTDEITQII